MTDDWRSRSRDGAPASNYGRRRFIAVGTGVGAALLAGCTSDDGSGNGDGTATNDGGDGGAETAAFRLLVSDAPADIDDFDRLDVTFEQARIFEGGDGEGTETEGTDEEGTATANGTETGTHDETVEEDQQQGGENGSDAGNDTSTENETATETDGGNGTESETGTGTESGSDGAEGNRGFYILELDSPTVDLTQVVGDVAQPIFDGELEAGSYRKLELHVERTEGIVDGEEVEVNVPSVKLQLTKPFEVRAGEELDFVFDINVVKRGNQDSYNLKPVISQSGVRGEDVEVQESSEGAGSDAGAGSNGTDDSGDDGAGAGAGNGSGGGTGNGSEGNETGA
jgi:hypothetical protein